MTTATEYLGLSKKSAQDNAERKNLIFRLIRIDAEAFLPYPAPDDNRDDRVCVELDAGRVTKAEFR